MNPNDNDLLDSNIESLLGTSPEPPLFNEDRRAAVLAALHEQQAKMSGGRFARPSLLFIIPRVFMMTAAVLVVAKLFWTPPGSDGDRPQDSANGEMHAELPDLLVELEAMLQANTEGGDALSQDITELAALVSRLNAKTDYPYENPVPTDLVPKDPREKKTQADNQARATELDMIMKKARMDQLLHMGDREMLVAFLFLSGLGDDRMSIKNLDAAETDLIRKQDTLGTTHPVVLNAQGTLDRLRLQLNEEVSGIRDALRKEYLLAKNRYMKEVNAGSLSRDETRQQFRMEVSRLKENVELNRVRGNNLFDEPPPMLIRHPLLQSRYFSLISLESEYADLLKTLGHQDQKVADLRLRIRNLRLHIEGNYATLFKVLETEYKTLLGEFETF